MKEVAASLHQRKRLLDKASKLENEVCTLESPEKERSPAKAAETKSPRAPPHTSPTTMPSPSMPVKVAKSSPRRRQDSSGDRKSPKNKSGSGEQMESFDARLKSIITNALIGDGPVIPKAGSSKLDCGPVRHTGKQPMSAKDYMEARTHANNMASRVMAAVDYTQVSPAKMVLKNYGGPGQASRDSVAQSEHKTEEDKKAAKEKTEAALSMLSLPVKIPLHDVNKPKTVKSLPVSIPLSNMPESQEHGHKETPKSHHSHHHLHPGHHYPHHHHHRERVEGAKGCVGQRPGSPLMREAYSPISRPSSSSSTASGSME